MYERYVLPHLINLACGSKPVMKQRQKVVPQAQGRVLEIGMGSGLNIPLYDKSKVDILWGLEPSEGMRQKAQKRVARAPFELRWLDLPGEEIPLDNNSVDCVVLTYTLCTIPGWEQALRQMRRALKPGGQLLFSEHGKAPDVNVQRWQNRINPYWNKIAGGCHVNRDIPELLRRGGFDIARIETMYVPGTPKFTGFTYWGCAT